MQRSQQVGFPGPRGAASHVHATNLSLAAQEYRAAGTVYGIGEVPGRANLFSAFGHSHYGFGMAPNTGRIVAELVSGQQPNVDITPYRIDRFT